MENEYLNVRDPNDIRERLEDLSSLYKYVSILESQKEHRKSRQILNMLINIVRSLGTGVIQKRHDFSAAYQLFAGNCMAVGEVKKAHQLCREGLQFFPESDELRLFLGHCLTNLHQFEEAEKVFHQLDGKEELSESGLYTFRKSTKLGELYQRWGQLEEAEKHFKMGLGFRNGWIPAHIGLIELEIMKTNMKEAREYLAHAIKRFGPDPALMLTTANLALISSNFAEADDLAANLQGKLLGDDRFEYLLFQIDFFKGDHDSLSNVPYLMTGKSVETEAARIWAEHFKGKTYEEDPLRIPKDVWREEYNELNTVWQGIQNNE